MLVGRVTGSVVSTNKAVSLMGVKMLIVQPVELDTLKMKDDYVICVDDVGAGEGEIVMWAGGSSSRQTDLTTNKPVDSSIVGIVDFVDIQGKRVYRKGDEL